MAELELTERLGRGLVSGDDFQQLHLVNRRKVVHADHLKDRTLTNGSLPLRLRVLG